MSVKKSLSGAIGRPRAYIRRAVGRARFLKSIQPGDTFIATYPKSGTNWVSFLLALVIADRATGTRSVITLEEASRWVPGVNTQYLNLQPLPNDPLISRPRVFKLHAPYDRRLGRVVYLVRDPRDVMVSYYYHNRRKKLEFELSIDEYVERNECWPCDWGVHVSGWLQASAKEWCLIVRYEDLKADPVKAFRRIVDFSGFELSDVELEDYIERSSFQNMRRAEEAVGEREARDIRFTRRGIVGDWKTELSARSVRLIESRYGELMSSLSYDLVAGTGESKAESNQTVTPQSL